MTVAEHALIGCKEIAEYLCLSKSVVYGKYIPKMKEYGIIFYRRIGEIPHRREVIFTFPSLVQRFLIETQRKPYSKSKVLRAKSWE